MKDAILILVVFSLTAMFLPSLDMKRPEEKRECLSWNKRPSYKWVMAGDKIIPVEEDMGCFQ